MRIVGADSGLTAKELDRRSVFLREVIRRNPGDASLVLSFNDAGDAVLGTYGAIVGVELMAGRFQSLAEIARSYGCTHMNLIEAFNQMAEAGLIEKNAEKAVTGVGAFKRSTVTASLVSAVADERFVPEAMSEMDSELYEEALSQCEEHYLDAAEKATSHERSILLEVPERRLEILGGDEFAALCAHFANAGKQIATVSIGNGIEVSPLAMILLHELSKGPLKLNSVSEIAKVYGVRKPGLSHAFQGLVDCAMVLADPHKEGPPQYSDAQISENGKRVLENRKVALSMGSVLLSLSNEKPYVSREAYSLLQIMGPGMTVNTTIGSECLKRSRGYVARVLGDMEDRGLLVRNQDLSYAATPMGLGIVKAQRVLDPDSVAWLRSAPIQSQVKSICDDLLGKANQKSLAQQSPVETAPDNLTVKLQASERAEVMRQQGFAEKALRAEKARRIAVQEDAQRISNHLINLASKKNRQEFYAYEIGFVPGAMEQDALSGNAIRRDAVKYLFDAGFFSFKDDFADTLANGIKPSEYQPAVTLHPLGDYHGSDFYKFDRSRIEYDDFRLRSYMRAVTVRPRSMEAICKAQKFDIEDFQDFVDTEVKDKLVSYCWAMDVKSGALIKGVVLNGIDIQNAKRFESPSLDWLSLNGPTEGALILKSLGLQHKDERINFKITQKLCDVGVIVAVPDSDSSQGYVLNADRSDQELKAALKECKKFATKLDSQFVLPLGLINHIHQRSYVRTKDLYTGHVGYSADGTTKPTEDEISKLVKSGALDRYKSRTGVVDYLMVPLHLNDTSQKDFTTHVEDCLMGVKKAEQKHFSSMGFEEFNKRKEVLGIELQDSETHSFNMARAIYDTDSSAQAVSRSGTPTTAQSPGL